MHQLPGTARTGFEDRLPLVSPDAFSRHFLIRVNLIVRQKAESARRRGLTVSGKRDWRRGEVVEDVVRASRGEGERRKLRRVCHRLWAARSAAEADLAKMWSRRSAAKLRTREAQAKVPTVASSQAYFSLWLVLLTGWKTHRIRLSGKLMLSRKSNVAHKDIRRASDKTVDASPAWMPRARPTVFRVTWMNLAPTRAATERAVRFDTSNKRMGHMRRPQALPRYQSPSPPPRSPPSWSNRSPQVHVPSSCPSSDAHGSCMTSSSAPNPS